MIRRPIWADVVVFLFLAGVLYVILNVAQSMAGPRRAVVEIDLSVRALPKYVGWSVFRNGASFVLSFLFTFIYGYIAGKSRYAHKVMIPILDIFQSVPVLAFMPSTLLAVMALFPNSRFGLELVAIILIFTGQAWNMCFSFYYSLRSLPDDLLETTSIYRFGWWRRFWKLELPFAAIPLMWNAKMSLAGGWFFLTVIESIKLGDQSFLLPGIGSYMSVANAHGDVSAIVYGIIAMTITIVVIDQLLWWPVIAWSQKFKYEETAGAETADSLVLGFVRQSMMLGWFGRAFTRIQEMSLGWLLGTFALRRPAGGRYLSAGGFNPTLRKAGRIAAFALLGGALAGAAFGSLLLLQFIRTIPGDLWIRIGKAAALTFLRIVATVGLSSLWMVPLGIVIGLKPRLSQKLQPIIQVVASFPAPMIYPLIAGFLVAIGLPIGYAAVILLTIGTQWYMLFNATAGGAAIPHDLVEVARSYRFSRWRTWSKVYLPASLACLVTGWVTTAGGAWNASIVAEYVYIGTKPLAANGLGAMITGSTEKAELQTLTACVLVMIFVVVVVNRLLWEPLFRYTSKQFSLAR